MKVRSTMLIAGYSFEVFDYAKGWKKNDARRWKIECEYTCCKERYPDQIRFCTLEISPQPWHFQPLGYDEKSFVRTDF